MAPDIATTIKLGLAHHQGGRLAEAEATYRSVLREDPKQPDALHLLGVVAHQRGQEDEALSLITAAIEANPRMPQYYSNRGEVRRVMGALELALADYEHALELDPDYADAHFNLANVLRTRGRHEDSIAHYRRAIALKPGFDDARRNLDALLRDLEERTDGETASVGDDPAPQATSVEKTGAPATGAPATGAPATGAPATGAPVTANEAALDRLRDRYGLLDYGDDGSLRVSVGLWVTQIYLARHILIVLIGGISSFLGRMRSLDFGGIAEAFSGPIFLTASVPAAVVMAAYTRRIPTGGDFARRLWAAGRWLLLLSVALDLALLFLHRPSALYRASLFYVAGVLIDVYIVGYLALSTRVRDTFASFPGS